MIINSWGWTGVTSVGLRMTIDSWEGTEGLIPWGPKCKKKKAAPKDKIEH